MNPSDLEMQVNKLQLQTVMRQWRRPCMYQCIHLASMYLVPMLFQVFDALAAAAAKLLQSCPTLCDPIDGSPPGPAVPGILQARTPEWVAISSSNAWKPKVKEKSLSREKMLALMSSQPSSWATNRYINKKCQGVGSVRVKIRVEGTEPDWAAAPCYTVREALSTEMMWTLRLNHRQKQHWRDLGRDFPGEARADTKTLSSRYWRNRRKKSEVEM